MLKHGLIADGSYWNQLVHLDEHEYQNHIQKSVVIKWLVVIISDFLLQYESLKSKTIFLISFRCKWKLLLYAQFFQKI